MAKRPWQAQDLLRVEAVGEPQLSVTGRLAYVLERLDEENDRVVTSIHVEDPASGSTRALTTGTSDRFPRWAPDGHRLAFVSDRGGKPQLWLIDARGGEARQIKTEQRVESAPAWSPDGTRLAWVSRQFPGEHWAAYPGAPPGDGERARAAAQRARSGEAAGQAKPAPPIKVITELDHKADGSGYTGDLRRQVFVMTVPGEEEGEAPKVRQLTSGCCHHQEPAWSPGGGFLVVTSMSPEHPDQRVDLWQVEVENGALSQLVRGAGPITCPVWSPDGRWIAYIGHHQEHGRSTTPGLWLSEVVPGRTSPLEVEEQVCLTIELDRPVGVPVPSDVRYAGPTVAPVWEQGADALLFLAADRGVGKIYRAQVHGACREVLGSASCSVAAFHAAGGAIAYQANRDTDADQIYRWESGSSRQVTRVNRALLDEVAVSPAEPFTYAGAGGWEIDGWLVRPLGQAPGEPGPLVLMIHGGPHGIYGASFMFAAQLLASAGMTVLYTNPRGSQSYGQGFASAVVGDWGGQDYQDLMAGINAAVHTGLVRPSRLGVTGWSYGGYMTNWIITRTSRFAAAVTGACVSNLHSFYGTSDIGFSFGQFQWQGTPWGEPAKLLDRSPLGGVSAVHTPVLILHGEGDLRCPVEQADQLFTALRRLDRTAVLVRYPGEAHTFKRPSYRVDRYERTVRWFAHYLQEGGEQASP